MIPHRKIVFAVAVLLASTGLPLLAEEPAAGLGISNAIQVDPSLLISGQPTAKQLKAAAKAGYRTVIDLRTQAEDRGFNEEKTARRADLAYNNIEVNLDTLNQSKVLYFLMVAREAERPVLLHCSTGNRAGALYYSWLVLEKGMPEAEALEKARAAGLRDPLLGESIQAVVGGLKASQRPKD